MISFGLETTVMEKQKGSRRQSGFFSSRLPLTSPRARLILSSKDGYKLAEAIRAMRRKGKVVVFVLSLDTQKALAQL